MPDYRSMYDRQYIGHWDLEGKDVTVTIKTVRKGELQNEKGKSKKPILYFEGKEKGYVCPITCSKIIASMYGNKTEDWIGQRITLYATKCDAFGQTVDCIRVRPKKPAAIRSA